ncbi:MAG: HAD hydrolase-like protein [Oscillospiraceae bacterium]|nr:HAD hydrolase-like protein [Oscillospiraceae bacterium]
MYRYVLFDFDGTLYDTVEGIAKSAQYALRKLGVRAELDELRCFAGPPLVDKFMEMFGFSLEKAWEARGLFQERYIPIGVYESRPFPGMTEFLTALKDAGLVLAVATSKPLPLCEQLLERSGMREFFSVVRGSGLAGNNNTKREIVESVIDDLGAGKEDCVLIGDTKYDVAGAHAAGIPCICVRYGCAAPGELEEAGADAIAADLSALQKMLTCGEKLL